ncbi:type VII toxin-antitoxin system MntA family adenylyltransferase antitoxin [Halomonas lysinitropha]|uniref:Nucleotidyltransferase domain protein n=1 Tax=Halomonas lysinitropha TaxID=2607506 RepID=A0A5K1IC91_9GAMM|nr:nucleotidyltransferase domain-containing protein [Halomonas lysinitropha]VVZ97089.1 Nucleotidyltransferase domain protein [Halomonas lysinitropha]
MPHQSTMLKALVDMAAEETDIAVLWLYGSRAKGTASPDSDYDLAVAFRDFAKAPLERRLRPELLSQDWQDRLGLPHDRLSIVDINLAPLPLAHAVIRTGQVLRVNDRLRLIREENRITSMWELDHQYHQRHFA